jgi:Fe-S-cluster containining protein
MKPSELKQFERSYCDCDMCKAGCKSMPGILAPGDLDTIAEYVGVNEPDEKWVSDHFAASEGAMVITLTGEITRIPTIVPKQKADGCCVFLTAENKCSVHPVSPMGCRCFNICGGPNETEEQTSKAILSSIAQNIDYNMLHDWMIQTGNTTTPITARKQALKTLLEDID